MKISFIIGLKALNFVKINLRPFKTSLKILLKERVKRVAAKELCDPPYLWSLSMASVVTDPTSRSRAAVIRPPYNVIIWGLADKHKE